MDLNPHCHTGKIVLPNVETTPMQGSVGRPKAKGGIIILTSLGLSPPAPLGIKTKLKVGAPETPTEVRFN